MSRTSTERTRVIVSFFTPAGKAGLTSAPAAAIPETIPNCRLFIRDLPCRNCTPVIRYSDPLIIQGIDLPGLECCAILHRLLHHSHTTSTSRATVIGRGISARRACGRSRPPIRPFPEVAHDPGIPFAAETIQRLVCRRPGGGPTGLPLPSDGSGS